MHHLALSFQQVLKVPPMDGWPPVVGPGGLQQLTLQTDLKAGCFRLGLVRLPLYRHLVGWILCDTKVLENGRIRFRHTE